MSRGETVRQILDLAEAPLAEAAADVAARTGLPVAAVRALFEADPRVRELRGRYLLQAAAVDACAAPGLH